MMLARESRCECRFGSSACRFLRPKGRGARCSGSIAACDAPNVAHLAHKVGVCLAFVLKRVENVAYEHDVELICRSRTQLGAARCCLVLDNCARYVERVEEVLRSLGLLLGPPPERRGALGDRSPLIDERRECVEH